MRSRCILLWSVLPILLAWGVHVPRNKNRYSRIARPLPSSKVASYPRNSRASETGRRRWDESEFVTAPGDGHLYLNDELFDFRAFNTPSLFQTEGFEVRDLLQTIIGFGTPVTRTYTLQVANTMFEGGKTPASEAHVIGWDEKSNTWAYNETIWERMDYVLHQSREYGVKLIIPIINQDYGTSDTDFVGNFNDLIRHRYGIWGYRSTNQAIDWFTDRQMIESYKNLITYLLNRVNTFNGIRYGDDETVLAFETGNELNWGDSKRITFQRNPPSKWTLEIAQHIKSLAPNTLVMDGSYSRRAGQGPFWDQDVLDSKYIDLYSYHLYGDKDLDSYNALHKEVRAHGKTLVIGEHGFYSEPDVYSEAYRRFDCAGALIWSLRGHSRNGGFVTHSEGNNIYSYHAPGWRNQTSQFFDTQEADVMSATYDASYTILGLKPAPKPIPGTPQTFFLSNGTHVGLSWRGGSWADHYEIFGGHLQGLFFDVVSSEVQDNVGPGEVFIPLDPNEPTKLLIVHRGKPKRRESHKGWIDRKWCFPGTRCWRSHFFDKPYSSSDHRSASSSDPSKLNLKTSSNPSQASESSRYRILAPMFPTGRKRAIEGGWYSVRGINSDGVPGKRSRASFLKSDWIDWHSTELET